MRLRQVLVNLLDNALTHDPVPGEDADVTFELSHDRAAVRLAVSHRGPGIPGA